MQLSPHILILADVALIENTAEVGGRIAAEYSKLENELRDKDVRLKSSM